MSEVRPILIHVSVVVLHGEHVLLVQEAKEINYGKWNLPGGHLEVGESILSGAIRELAEETLIKANLTGCIGIYTGMSTTGFHAIRFVFSAKTDAPTEARAGDQILMTRWFEIGEAKLLPDKDLVSPAVFRQILDNATQQRPFSLDLFRELLP